MSEFKIYEDKKNIREKKVLNTLTREGNKKPVLSNRFIDDTVEENIKSLYDMGIFFDRYLEYESVSGFGEDVFVFEDIPRDFLCPNLRSIKNFIYYLYSTTQIELEDKIISVRFSFRPAGGYTEHDSLIFINDLTRLLYEIENFLQYIILNFSKNINIILNICFYFTPLVGEEEIVGSPIPN